MGEVNEVQLLHRYIDSVMTGVATHFTSWPEGNTNPLQYGVPTGVEHILLEGIHSFQVPNGPQVPVAAVTFIAGGGHKLEKYEYVPMMFSQLTGALYSDFKAQKKYVFVNALLYNSVVSCGRGMISNTPLTALPEVVASSPQKGLPEDISEGKL